MTEIKYPTPATLKKYGLTLDMWKALLDEQGGICPICEKVPTSGRFVVDHQHIRGWKTMPPENRRKYIRALTCWYCNRYFLSKGITLKKARNVVTYLERYEARAID